MQWIGFIAGTTNLTLEVNVTNCNRNQGLEIGLYESFDCNIFRRISECDTDIQENEKRIFINTVPLVIGQYYYFVMDGTDNDICDWTIRVLSGSTRVAPLDIAPEIMIPEQVCQNDTFSLSTPGITGATFYNWSVAGVSKNGLTTKHAFTSPGTYEICLDAFNVCSQAPQRCKTMTVLPNATSKKEQQICFGECFQFYGKSYCETGTYPVTLPAANGCDSIVMLDLVVDDRITASTSLKICEGDTLFLGDKALTTEGIHPVVIKNQEECSVYMDVRLQLIACQMQSADNSLAVRCNGENTGTIRFAVTKGTPPFTYTGFKIENPSITFSGNISTTNTPAEISGVDEGNYTFTIRDTFGNSTILTSFVAQPPSLKLEATTSQYQGFAVSCADSADGHIKYLPSGGNGGYTLLHQEVNGSSDSLTGLRPGIYTTQVTDRNGCTASLRIELNAPPPLKMTSDIKNPDCTGKLTGIITASATTARTSSM